MERKTSREFLKKIIFIFAEKKLDNFQKPDTIPDSGPGRAK
jgi:hypothetical protein